MDWYIIPLIFLALFAVFRYFRGMRKNKWISGFISAETEGILKPQDTNYVNIGGAIGYNFTYKLGAPFKEAKGTFALVPRQSAFYMPVVWLAGGRDRYYINIFATAKLAGEGHIIDERYFPKISKTIAGIEKLKTKKVSRGGASFILFWDAPKLEKKLADLVEFIDRPELLRHFCCYRDNSNFYLFMEPKKDGVSALLGSILKRLSSFWGE